MATIETRRTADGAIGYRSKVRLKGFPSESATFERKTDAKAKKDHPKISKPRRSTLLGVNLSSLYIKQKPLSMDFFFYSL